MSLATTVLNWMFGNSAEKKIKPYWKTVEQINALEPTLQPLSDDQLQAKTSELKSRLKAGETLQDILPEAFAVVREASKRVLKMRHFDVQLIGGMVLNDGKIAEMKTGEGKTLMSTLAAYLNALEERGVYIVTVNDYLAARDHEWMGKLYQFLGLSVGLIQANMPPDQRLQAYACDITYGTNNEFGFDYLRDNLALDISQCCQSRRHFAIVDEVDSILIDEARTPLIISGPVQDSTERYKHISQMVRKLKIEDDFTVDEKHKNIILTEDGVQHVEKLVGITDMYSVENMEVAHMTLNCLKALHLFKRDVDYVIKDGEIIIVDEFTGRLMDGRRYSDGLHQAIEAIENLNIREESQTLASITFQNYFRMFPKLAGMTGTAQTEEEEFIRIYGLEVAVIPTNKPINRKDEPDIVFKSKEEKYRAIVKEVKARHEKGQPVLLGTISIEVSEYLSQKLKNERIAHHVLNAKYHEKEAEIIALAGQKNAVTIATNMAGRGTDIVLGDNVRDLGGLYVIGSERHESRRIDNQLRGRSGRQGDPGESRFYVSLQDDLMRLFGSDRIIKIMETLGLPEDTPIEHKMVTRSIGKAQGKVEKYHFGVRKQILQYDDVMNRQRETVYSMRHQILEKRALTDKVTEFMETVIDNIHASSFPTQSKDAPATETVQEFFDQIRSIIPIKNIDEVAMSGGDKLPSKDRMLTAAKALYDMKKNQVPDGLFEDVVTKRVILMVLDRKWVDHLNMMEMLREGIGLRAYGQKDPLMEYKIEAFDMFNDLLLHVATESLEVILHSSIVENKEGDLKNEAAALSSASPQNELQSSAADSATKEPGRNDSCPCGSGKKYKKCCMK